MIVLTVLSHNGVPAQGLSAQFDELGGSIGRADTNQLVLPDPERMISRVHAKVLFRNGGFVVLDSGSNPISVNGRPLGSGREHPLVAGDELDIGGYRLRASAACATAVSSDPFADLFGSAATGLAAPPPAPAPMRSVMKSWPAASAGSPSATDQAPPAPLSPGQIPVDWDPFAFESVPSPAGAQGSGNPGHSTAPMGTAASSVPIGMAGLDRGESLDDLFSISGLSGLSGLTPSADPLGISRPKPPEPSTLELGSELQTPMPWVSVQAPALPAELPASMPAQLPSGAIFSWDTQSGDAAPLTLIKPRAKVEPVTAPVPAPPAAPVAMAPQPMTAAAHKPPTSLAVPPATATGSTSDAALLSALLQGLGVPGLRLDALTPELMLLIGQLLRESTRGAVELLVARAALKREMRAQMTMIVPRENNPLKFSPSVEVALQHLLGPASPGFMAPVASMHDAFVDLRAHQLAVMAGMRAALDGVLERFDPSQLEGKLTRRSAIDSLIPATRKARLWDAFNELFSQLQGEAQDDFEELFGKAFLRAYQAQLEQLDAQG